MQRVSTPTLLFATPASISRRNKPTLFCLFSANLYSHQKIFLTKCFVGFNPVCSD